MLQFLPFLRFFLNPMKLIELVLKNWKAIVAFAVLGVALFGFLHVRGLYKTIERKDHEISILQQRIDACKGNVEALETAIDQQNASIDAALKAGREAERRIRELEGELTEIEREHEREIKDILDRPRPETCEGAIDYLKNVRGGLKWDDQ